MSLCGLYDKPVKAKSERMTSSALAGSKLCGFIATRDRVRAKAFYQDVLGLTLVSDDQFAVVFELNGNQVRVTPVQDYTPVPFTVLGWEVSDIEVVVDRLTKSGVHFEKYDFLKQDARGVWTVPGGGAQVAWFKDPDGNVLSVAQHS
jgi:catechol 2,3-dioxygenase-like lactoylglutathione lyase family enzyme